MTLEKCLEQFIQKHYVVACESQRRLTGDIRMIDMLQHGECQPDVVKSWMRDYGLFQGVKSADRDEVVLRFMGFASGHKGIDTTDAQQIREWFIDLHRTLFQGVSRKWTSASSKLLWCLHPHDIVIYDSFVERTLIVLQPLDKSLLKFPRIGAAPRVLKEFDIHAAADHYLNYQSMVRDLSNRFTPLLNELRAATGESYPYDIRIIDKILWMIGDPSWSFGETS